MNPLEITTASTASPPIAKKYTMRRYPAFHAATQIHAIAPGMRASP